MRTTSRQAPGNDPCCGGRRAGPARPCLRSGSAAASASPCSCLLPGPPPGGKVSRLPGGDVAAPGCELAFPGRLCWLQAALRMPTLPGPLQSSLPTPLWSFPRDRLSLRLVLPYKAVCLKSGKPIGVPNQASPYFNGVP